LSVAMESKKEMQQWYTERMNKLTGQNSKMRERSCSRMIKHWQYSSASSCFNTWKTYAFEMRAQRVRVSRMLLNWQNARTARCFRSWYEVLKRKRGYRNKLSRFIKQYKSRCLARSWNTWRSFYTSRVVEREEEARKEEKLRGFIRRWKSGLLGMVIHEWRRFARISITDKLEAARSAEFATLKAQMEANLQKQELKLKQATAKRFLKRLKSVNLWPAFHTWKGNVERELDTEEKQQHAQRYNSMFKRVHDVYECLSGALAGAKTKHELIPAFEIFSRRSFQPTHSILFFVLGTDKTSMWSLVNGGKQEVYANIGVGISGKVAATGKPAVVENARTHPDFVASIDDAKSTLKKSAYSGDDGPLSLVATPIFNESENSVAGVYVVTAPGDTERAKFLLSHGPRIMACGARVIASALGCYELIASAKDESTRKALEIGMMQEKMAETKVEKVSVYCFEMDDLC